MARRIPRKRKKAIKKAQDGISMRALLFVARPFLGVRARSLYYDRKGNPITLEDWGRLKERSGDYWIVKKTIVGEFEVSTVWLGLDHGLGEGRPIIFETAICDTQGPDIDVIARYCTEEEAFKGHEEICEKARPQLQDKSLCAVQERRTTEEVSRDGGAGQD